jgi:hypothetical protein
MGQNMWGYCCALAIAASFTLAAPLRAEDAVSNESPSPRTNAKLHVPSESERRIEAALDMPLRAPLEFIETPLNQITQVIAEDYEIPIVFDTNALDAVASSPEIEATISIANVTLRSALDLMLRNAGAEELTYIIDHEVLLITTEEEAEKRLETRVYRVDDLVVDDRFAAASERDAGFDQLRDVIVSTVEHESWMENGTGEGEIEHFQPGMIVISQTRRVHDQIETLLQRLRTAKAEIDADAADEQSEAANQPVTRSVSLNDEAIADCQKTRDTIREALQKSVNWQSEVEGVENEELFLYVLPNRVLVRHVPDIVRQVENVVREIVPAALPAAKAVSTSGGGSGCIGGSPSSEPSSDKESTPPTATANSNADPDLADAPADGEDGNQRQQRGGGGGFF